MSDFFSALFVCCNTLRKLDKDHGQEKLQCYHRFNVNEMIFYRLKQFQRNKYFTNELRADIKRRESL
jgi:hypothetical protein